jgi:hypothetical protein
MGGLLTTRPYKITVFINIFCLRDILSLKISQKREILFSAFETHKKKFQNDCGHV